MDADDATMILCDNLKFKKQALKELEAHVETLATMIKCRMGHASTLIYQGQKIATWKSNKDSVTTDWRASCMALSPSKDHIYRFTKTAPGNRPLLIK